MRSAATLSGGQLVATAISFGLAPILSRLYAPEDYGVLATYMSVAVILSAIANLQMARALVAEADEAQAHALLALSLWLAACFAGLTLVLMLTAQVAGFTGLEAIGNWLLLLPATVLTAGMGSALLGWSNRHHRYQLMSAFQIVNVIVSSGAALLLAWGGYGARGLMVGYFLGQFASFLIVFAANLPAVKSLRGIKFTQMRRAGVAHRNYAFWTTPTSMVEQLSAASPVLVLSLWANMLAMVGHYNRARSLLMLPVVILGGAIGQVFFRRAAQDMARAGHCRPLFWKLVVAMTAISVPTFALLALVAPQLFVLVLGPQWDAAGRIARILAPVMALQLIVMPAAKILWLYNRQRLDFFLSVFFAAATTLVVASVALLGFAPETAIDAFAGAQIALYLVYLALCIHIVERDHRARQESPVAAAPTPS